MAKAFHLTIARVGENLFDGEVVKIQLPGSEGVFTVLADHEPVIAELRPGEAHLETKEGEKKTISLPQNGVAEVSKNQATVLV